jgi:Cu(I)/Ag(I) efflux system membrane fusion protein
MKTATMAAMLLLVAASASAGFWAGRKGDLENLARFAGVDAAQTVPSASDRGGRGRILYYRHPEGDAEYSSVATKTTRGKPFVPVYEGEDVMLGEDGPVRPGQTAFTPPESGKVLYYRNPMGLADTSPVPKKDWMGMDYIPVYEGDGQDDSAVRVSAGKIQRTGVKTEKAVLGVVSRAVDVPGTVTLDERLVNVVAPRVEAFVETVADVTTGDRIEAGDELMRVYSRDVAAAGAQFLLDLSSGVPAKAMSGSRLRLKNLGVSDAVIGEMESTRAVPESIVVTAPLGGVVLERSAVQGMMASPGEVLFRIADLSRVWIIADVPEYLASDVAIGAKSVVRIRGLPGREFQGRVDRLYPEIRERTRTTRVRIELRNPDGIFLANMYADVTIEGRPNVETVNVADAAVIDTGKRQTVFVDLGEGRFEPRDVRVGIRSGGRTEILEGVSEGESVVVSGNFLIDAESNLNAAFSAFEPEVAEQ